MFVMSHWRDTTQYYVPILILTLPVRTSVSIFAKKPVRGWSYLCLAIERGVVQELGKEKMAASLMPNGVARAKTVAKRSRGFRRTSGNIAAIDFGTKNCSLAYVTEGPAGPPEKLPLNGNHHRVPTAILLDGAGEVMDFGFDARQRYCDLESSERENVYYFDCIKVNLQQDKVWLHISLVNHIDFFRVANIKTYTQSLVLKFIKS